MHFYAINYTLAYLDQYLTTIFYLNPSFYYLPLHSLSSFLLLSTSCLLFTLHPYSWTLLSIPTPEPFFSSLLLNPSLHPYSWTLLYIPTSEPFSSSLLLNPSLYYTPEPFSTSLLLNPSSSLLLNPFLYSPPPPLYIRTSKPFSSYPPPLSHYFSNLEYECVSSSEFPG